MRKNLNYFYWRIFRTRVLLTANKDGTSGFLGQCVPQTKSFHITWNLLKMKISGPSLHHWMRIYICEHLSWFVCKINFKSTEIRIQWFSSLVEGYIELGEIKHLWTLVSTPGQLNQNPVAWGWALISFKALQVLLVCIQCWKPWDWKDWLLCQSYQASMFSCFIPSTVCAATVGIQHHPSPHGAWNLEWKYFK